MSVNRLLSDALERVAELEKTCKSRSDTIIEYSIKISELELSRKDLIEEFAEAECLGEVAKIARQYGYEALKDQGNG